LYVVEDFTIVLVIRDKARW